MKNLSLHAEGYIAAGSSASENRLQVVWSHHDLAEHPCRDIRSAQEHDSPLARPERTCVGALCCRKYTHGAPPVGARNSYARLSPFRQGPMRGDECMPRSRHREGRSGRIRLGEGAQSLQQRLARVRQTARPGRGSQHGRRFDVIVPDDVGASFGRRANGRRRLCSSPPCSPRRPPSSTATQAPP